MSRINMVLVVQFVAVCFFAGTIQSAVINNNDQQTRGSDEPLLAYIRNKVRDLYHNTSSPNYVDFALFGSDKLLLNNGEDLEEWVPPFNIATRFPYYLAGHDDENRPLWISEWGKWNFREIVIERHIEEFDVYFKQLVHRVMRSIREQDTPEYPVHHASCLLDFDQFDVAQILHIPTMTYGLTAIAEYQNIVNKHLGQAIIINANFAAETLINLMKPIFGGIFERVSVFGSSKSKWQPHILRQVSKKFVPEWYGGDAGFKPLKVYG